jgi:hypothetical protein
MFDALPGLLDETDAVQEVGDKRVAADAFDDTIEAAEFLLLLSLSPVYLISTFPEDLPFT